MPKRRYFDDFWEEFESQCADAGLVSKVPTMVKKLLTACGYNHAWAFKEVDNEKVTQLESFIQARHRKIADSFDEYREITPFEFLPGHRDLIFAIKTQILSFENTKKPKSKSNGVPTHVPDEDELKQILISQVSSYSSSLALQLDWGDAIGNFQTATDSSSAECSLSCSLCSAVRVIRYDGKYWATSNIYKHLRTHVKTNGEANGKTHGKPNHKPNQLVTTQRSKLKLNNRDNNKKIKSASKLGNKQQDGEASGKVLNNDVPKNRELISVQGSLEEIVVERVFEIQERNIQSNVVDEEWMSIIDYDDQDDDNAIGAKERLGVQTNVQTLEQALEGLETHQNSDSQGDLESDSESFY